MKKGSLVGLLFVAAPAAFAIVASPVGGVTPIDTTFNWVGQCNGASCIAIGARTVITARHVGSNGTVTINGVNYQELNHATSADYDITVINLTTSLPGFYNLANSISVGSTVTMVGYGGSGVVNAANNGYDITSGPGNIRRSGTNTFDFAQDVDLEGPSLLSFLGAAPDAAVVAGDSGGGWFVGNQVVGMSLFTFNLAQDDVNTIYPDYGFANANTNGYNIGGNSGAPGTAYFGSGALDLTNAGVRSFISANMVPEPASMLIIFGGIAGLAAKRRRK